MLNDSELAQMTEVIRDKLDSDELRSLGKSLGHHVSWTTTVFECDSHSGFLLCECGWRKHGSASWARERVQEHLEEVIGERFDAEGNER